MSLYDDPALQSVHAMRNLKLKRIPKDVMHKVPTTLLYSLEGMPGLDWAWLLRLQSSDGSFLFSPSSTAYALMQTGDNKCLAYLQKAVEKFNGGVPNVYPVDLFEHLWAVDRLERLGISRYFELEIKECMDYVHRYWTKDGIGWARNSLVQDVDDTSMGFRLLRLHGYDVSPVVKYLADVFHHFEMDGEFFCIIGQSNQAVTGMYNLNRASQIAFPGEEILSRAKNFSYKFLREKQCSGQLVDKWIITKDLQGEVEYALEFPWYSSLPRIETRLYLEQYGGGSDVWIGKTLYRMPYVNNDVYLELGKSDFNQCQAVHQLEWLELQKWYTECGLAEKGVSRGALLTTYFLTVASMIAPERAQERLGWARTTLLAQVVSSFFSGDSCSRNMRQNFI
ncbi:hypothetical protein J5N97_022969 [Dioscorea zingiberensis]|uniref:Terpene synthase N-terminal domain-containing protein n=1 Tax=Dioscorea zingiberensis TaxID=325984 RepID=A0A9D5CCL1_9LILI|nr:hypothetical protein J5N97_022969 [Dioscorea zingiberensis]